MRKDLKLVVIAACMLMLAGTASAYEFHLTEDDANVPYNGDIDVLVIVNDVSKTVEFRILVPTDDKVSMKTVLLNVPVAEIESVDSDNPNVDWVIEPDTGQGNAGFGAMLTAVDRDSGDQGTVQYIKIQMKDTWDGTLPVNVNDYAVVLHVTRLPGDPESLWLGGNGDGGITEIPEFPTVALPIAAVLGLAFMLQRRKE